VKTLANSCIHWGFTQVRFAREARTLRLGKVDTALLPCEADSPNYAFELVSATVLARLFSPESVIGVRFAAMYCPLQTISCEASNQTSIRWPDWFQITERR